MTGTILRDDQFQQIADMQRRIKVLEQSNVPKVSARVFNSVPISIATATVTPLTFDDERWDYGGLHVVNSSRLTAPISGLYTIGGSIRFPSNATGVRQIVLLINGATFVAPQYLPATGGDTALTTETEWEMDAGDYAELTAYQTSGGALNVIASVALSPEFWMSLRAI